MMSDHWKSIAKFLGTPGLPDDPAPEVVPQPAVDDKPAATQPVGAPVEPIKESPADEIRWDRDDDKKESQAAAILGSPEPKSDPLPGFEQKTTDAASSSWDSLVESFGIETVDEPAVQPRQTPAPAVAEKRSSPPPRRPEPSGGFGQGLGFDTEPKPEVCEPKAEACEPKADACEAESRDEFAGFGQLPEETETQSSPRNRDDAPRGRRNDSRERGEEPRSRSEEPRTRSEEPRTRSEEPRTRSEEPRSRSEQPRSRGGRGRRGARRDAAPSDEVMAQEAPAFGEPAEAKAKAEEPVARRGNNSPRRSESPKQQAPRRPRVDDVLNFSSFNDLPDDLDDIDLVGDEPINSEEPTVESVSPSDSDSDSEGNGDEGEPRRRRRGRRGGRRRGRGGNAAASEASETPETGELPEIEANADTAAPKASEFDDDHEDADEVIALRRGNRRRRGRRGRGGAAEGSESNDREDASSRPSAKLEADVRPSPRHAEASDDDTSEDIKPRQRDIPSWIETVDLLVQPNINARGKRTASRGRGNSNGRGRRRDNE
ncbi:hypothetical protein Poly24_21860 [Rosistilla carotiformis]|uniref:Uncharacterized protein n=1 Tax=Rosistilla carotiformis TaxID=2528017 RepID=A0A518JSH4_9BACT|nr:hypothetical protein [Rosistilla carotiformis]QDV68477.1 hypothetical protein Poly24_21860 [Rosistilla carotiformis]